jgi:hypothetical protein
MSTAKRSRVAEKRWVRKSDGRLEAFNRSKIRVSVLKAGASQMQARQIANTITASVRACELCEDVAGNKEVSSARLSNVVIAELRTRNKDAAERYSTYRVQQQQIRSAQTPGGMSTPLQETPMATEESQRLSYLNSVNALVSELTFISQQASNLPASMASLNDRVQRLPTRITRVRQGNYRALSHLEADQTALDEQWAAFSRDLQATTRNQMDAIFLKTRDLQQILTGYQRRANYERGNLQGIEAELAALHRNVSNIQSQVAGSLTPIEERYQQLDRELRRAETTVAIVADASFPWMEGETPIIAIKAKDLTNDVEGILTLTNHRFIFERETEVVLKRRLFIVTEKKIVREVAVQTPIGMVTQLAKGRVGLLKGTGLFVEFASDSGLPAMKLDTTGQDAEWLTEGFKDVMSGQVQEELAAVVPEATPTQKPPQLVACQICGAPYTDRIYRGQTSVNCKYCGAAIAL